MTQIQSITLTQPDDWHLHLRDGAALASVIGHSAAQFARAIIMPNLRPPVTTTEQALAYYARIKLALESACPGSTFEPLMTLYLTDNTPPDEIARAHASGIVKAIKMYPAGATTNSDAGVSAVRHTYKALEAMQRLGMPLLIHGEVVDKDVDTFDREAVFIERELIPLRAAMSELKVVFEHITTAEAADYVKEASGPIAATITAQHLLFNRNAIFTGGLRPHFYCLPILKRERHRAALVAAATSGNPRYFLGTDSAPHASRLKENALCGAGCYTAHAAVEMYAEVFDAVGALDKLEGFASFFGADFYGLPRNTRTVTLERRAWTPPTSFEFGEGSLVPLRAGDELPWKLLPL